MENHIGPAVWEIFRYTCTDTEEPVLRNFYLSLNIVLLKIILQIINFDKVQKAMLDCNFNPEVEIKMSQNKASVHPLLHMFHIFKSAEPIITIALNVSFAIFSSMNILFYLLFC